MIEKIMEGTSAKPAQNITYAPVIKQKKTMSEGGINTLLLIVMCILFIAMGATYFVDELPDIVLEPKMLVKDAIWVAVCGFSISEIAKRIFVNKAHFSAEYKQAVKDSKDALGTLTDDELNARAEYCKAYEEAVYYTERNRMLQDAHISIEDYESLYQGRDIKALKESGLAKNQIKILTAIGRLKRIHYDADFLNSTRVTNTRYSPSNLYNVTREDRVNTISSAIFTVLGCLFCVSLMGDLVFSFSKTALFTAIVKITFTMIIVTTKAVFGWNLVMRTEINRLETQKEEIANLKRWFKEQRNERANIQSVDSTNA